MSDLYTKIDNSVLLNFLFYPRRQHSKPSDGAFDLAVPVTGDVSIICRAYPVAAEKPWILYFHGNGEVVSDYDGIAHLYRKRGLNLLVADYRGYGASGGKPTFAALVSDAGIILDYV
jgi:alpha-beta hydrolase superfamily lysophospholipase